MTEKEKIEYRNLVRKIHLQNCTGEKTCTQALGHSPFEQIIEKDDSIEEIIIGNFRHG